MADHKAPTAVTIAPLEEKSGLATFVERWWKLATVLAVALTAWTIWQHKSALDAEAGEVAVWADFRSKAPEDATGLPRGATADLLAIAEAHKGRSATAWIEYMAAVNAYENKDYDDAVRALERLESNHPKHPLVLDTYSFGSDANITKRSVVAEMRTRLAGVKAWRVANADQLSNPELPADAPRVRLSTDKGDIEVALYVDRAPKHCENFLKLVGEGYYDGIKFHRVVPGFMIQAGCPNTKDSAKEPATWGTGGPGYKVDREESGLKHFEGFLAAAKQGGDTQSSGSQFYITVADANQLDKDYVVFGKVLSGMDTAHAIEKLEIAEGTVDRPDLPAVITKATKL